MTWVAPARHHGAEWRGRMDRSEGPEPAGLFEMRLPAPESALGPGET